MLLYKYNIDVICMDSCRVKTFILIADGSLMSNIINKALNSSTSHKS